jgi:hypothetical protein
MRCIVAIAFFFSLKKVCAIWFSPCLRALSGAADLRIEELLMLRARHSFFVFTGNENAIGNTGENRE